MTATVAELWRYPVKSMMGETLEALEFGPGGAAGDRSWAVRDEVRGGIRGAKKIPALMRCAARYPETPPPGPSRPAIVTLPDGGEVATGDDAVHARLSAALDHEVTLWPLVSAEQLDHYRRGAPTHDDLERELRATFGRTDDEPLPDVSAFPPELAEFESPPGTYFDALPVLVMTTSGLAALAAANPGSRFDVRRFRPNVLIDTGTEPGFPERDWIGRTLHVGALALNVELSCPRCVMTTHGFDDLPKDPKVMRTLVQENGGDLGVYCSVATPGTVRTGDTVRVE
jgi:uncharacterized protein YcbX